MQLKQRLKRGELALGSWITLAHPAIPEILAKAGFDWLAVDLEHSVITIREAEELIRVIELAGASPLVRLTSNDPNLIKRVMDAGAHGVIVPMINSAEDAKKAIDSLYYPPRGKRGVGLARGQGYGARFQEYKEWMRKEGPLLIVQIEHHLAVEAAEEILSLEGVDGYILGPYDLSASMGKAGEFDHPDVVRAMEKAKAAGKKAGKPGGIHLIEPRPGDLAQKIEEGFRFLAYSLDIRILDVAAREAIERARKTGKA